MWLLSPGVWDSTGVTLQASKSTKLNFGLKFLGPQWFNGRNSINGLNPGGENVQPTKKVELFLKAPSVFSLVYQVEHLIPWFLTWMIQKNRLKTNNFLHWNRGGFENNLLFSSRLLGKWSNLVWAYFSDGLKAPTSLPKFRTKPFLGDSIHGLFSSPNVGLVTFPTI